MAGSRTECRADRRWLCPRAHTHLDLLETSTRDAMRDSSASQTDRSPQPGPLSQPLRPGLQKFHFPARKGDTFSPRSQSKNSGRSGQQASCGAWSAKHSRSDTNVTPSSRAKRVTPADTRWHPCFVRQRKGPHQIGGRHAKWTNSMQQRMENGAQRCNGGGGHRKVSCDHASRSINAVFLCTLVVVLIPQWARPGSTQTSMRRRLTAYC